VSFDARGDRTGNAVALRIWRRSPNGRIDYAGNDIEP
jgi:branched-chain amino acid transport system substrate-binding protein